MRILIKNCTIFDGTGGEPIENGALVINESVIEYIGVIDKFENLEVDEVIDLNTFENPYVLPGLIDTHLHLAHGGTDKREKVESDALVSQRMVHNGIINLLSGVTTVRDCGTKNHIDVLYKKARQMNLIAGPATYISGKPLIATGGHCTYMGRQFDGPFEAMKATREQIDVGVDFIKIMVTGGIVTPTGTPTTSQLTFEEIEACVKVAHMNNKKVAVHAQGGPGLQDCIDAGVDIIEHGIYLEKNHIQQMMEKRIPYVPTLSAIYSIAMHGETEEVPLSKDSVEKSKRAVDNHFESFRMAKESGLLIAAGTDYKHGTLWLELELMTKAGFNKKQALLSATRDAAKVLGIDHLVGTLEKGKIADLVIYDNDPLKDFKNLAKPKMVFQNGKLVVKDGLLSWPRKYKPAPIQE